MAMLNKTKTSTLDNEFYTYKEDWESIKNYIPTDKVVWEPFSDIPNLEGVAYLKSICREVIMKTGDFFDCETPECDYIISNPPFSIKKQILEKLKILDKPFILILPTLSIQTKYMKHIFNDELQIIMPTKKMFFYKFNEDGTKHKIDKLSYYCSYVCYKMNLPKDFILI
jgi:hypothetical protein